MILRGSSHTSDLSWLHVPAIRKYCLVAYCIDSLFVIEYFIIVRGCEKHPYTPTLPPKKGSAVSLYIPVLVLSPYPPPKKKDLQCPCSIVKLKTAFVPPPKKKGSVVKYPWYTGSCAHFMRWWNSQSQRIDRP